MPVILAIETATKLCSVALLRDGSVCAIREAVGQRNIHAEKLNVFIAEVLSEAGLSMKDLSAVAVGTGPGSYTGLRIGLSAAKGLCYALEIPVIGMSTLGILVAEVRSVLDGRDRPLWPMIDARRMEVFTQAYSSDGLPVADASPVILDDPWARANEPCMVFGDGADKAAELWSQYPGITHMPGITPTASAMAKEAEKRFSKEEFDDLAYLVPEYGKAANVTRPGNKPI